MRDSDKKKKPEYKKNKPHASKNKGSFGTNKPSYKKPKSAPAERETVRLNKYLANAGIASRRESDKLIQDGLVEVNGIVITEMGFQVKPTDEVRYDGRVLRAEKPVYLLLNKPKGYVTTTKDERDRKTVMELVANATKSRIFPVGRLDRQTTGVLLFTNDGDFAKKLTHPSHKIRKVYHVVLNENLSQEHLEQLREGVRLLPEGVAKVDEISYIPNRPKNEVGVEIHIGWNRVVRRIFERLGYKVEKLDRVSFAELTKKNLSRGEWRILPESEVNFLKTR